MKVAYVISSHGFGHAARSCAILTALAELCPEIEVEIWCGVPGWFFEDSLGGLWQGRLVVHDVKTDLGLVQKTALEEDLDATVDQLQHWVPSPEPLLTRLCDDFVQRGITHVVADISPLGLDAATRLGLPAALVENFTWDWIYRGYVDEEPRLAPFAERLQGSFEQAQCHLHLEPFCSASQGAVTCPPVSRRPRLSRQALRSRLGIPHDEAMVLVTMGGIEWNYNELEGRLAHHEEAIWLVIPGSCREAQRQGRVVRLPHRSDFYHPDLMHGADAVVGKLGYSTLAEVWSAGVPLAYIPRRRFPESPPLEAWVQEQIPNLRISNQRFITGDWLDDLPRLLALGTPRAAAREPQSDRADGAVVAAKHLLRWMDRET